MHDFQKNMMIRMIVIIILSIIPQFFLPFPYGIILGLAIIAGNYFFMRKAIISRYGSGYGAGKFGGIEFGSKLSKTCTVCGSSAKGVECKRCGSKSFKMS
ncbi:MAG: hypothetical protein GTO44_09990 [Hydrotalea flava]|nr:hypothetical protein [Hydrotalea flava]NIN15383.1 hypothetical protein [Hydrotalea flava]